MSEVAEEIGKESLEETAFKAYNDKAGGKTYDGKDIPPFSEVGDKVRANWVAAVEAVVKALDEKQDGGKE